MNNKRLGMGLVIVAAAALIGAAAGGWLFLNSQKSSSDTGKYSGWKTFSSASLKFSIKYPAGWRVEGGEFDEDGVAYVQLFVGKEDSSYPADKPVVPNIEVEVKNYKDEPWKQLKDVRPIMVDGVAGYAGATTLFLDGEMIAAQKGSFTYAITIYGGPEYITETDRMVRDSFMFVK